MQINVTPCVSGLAALSPSDGRDGVYEDLKWKSLLCCELPFAQTVDSGLSEHQPVEQCQLLNATKLESSGKSLALSGKFILSDITVIAFLFIYSYNFNSDILEMMKDYTKVLFFFLVHVCKNGGVAIFVDSHNIVDLQIKLIVSVLLSEKGYKMQMMFASQSVFCQLMEYAFVCLRFNVKTREMINTLNFI